MLVHFVVECFRLLALQEDGQNPVLEISCYQCQRVGNARPFLSWQLFLLISPTYTMMSTNIIIATSSNKLVLINFPTSSCTSVRALDLTLPMTTKAHLGDNVGFVNSTC